MRPLFGAHGLSSLESWWGNGGNSGGPEAVVAGPAEIPLSGTRNSRDGKGVPVFSYLAPLSHFHLLSCLWDKFPAGIYFRLFIAPLFSMH